LNVNFIIGDFRPKMLEQVDFYKRMFSTLQLNLPKKMEQTCRS